MKENSFKVVGELEFKLGTLVSIVVIPFWFAPTLFKKTTINYKKINTLINKPLDVG